MNLVALMPVVPMVLFVLTTTMVPDKWYFTIEWLSLSLMAGLVLSCVLSALVVATLAKFEPDPPLQKFYDPDRLE